MRRVLSHHLLERVREVTGARAIERVQPVQRLWSGYGEIVRVQLAGAATPSVIVKHVQPPALAAALSGEQRRSHARKLRSYAVEQAFYARHAARCGEGCRVTRALCCEPALLVLEDLDAAGWSERRHPLPARGLTACLDWLAQFHATFMHVPTDDVWPVGTYWHLDTRPDELARTSDARLRAAAGQLDARLRGAHHRTWVHGDAKLDNFCFRPELASAAAVDFQYVGGGCGVQDVAYFLGSCLDAAACERRAPGLLDHYFASLARALGQRPLQLDVRALEAEWRALYPVAWADFCRFLSGWTQEPYVPDAYAEQLLQRALGTQP